MTRTPLAVLPVPSTDFVTEVLRHFMIYVDSTGCFEAIAESCELLPTVRVE